MKITASAISLNVDDPSASADFAKRHFGFQEEMAADGFVVVEDVDAEYARLLDGGIEPTTPIETEEWGERFFQVTDPNGVVFQLVTWIHPPADDA
jgi:uncharacterized glyoxalase superfamily protein PhnB